VLGTVGILEWNKWGSPWYRWGNGGFGGVFFCNVHILGHPFILSFFLCFVSAYFLLLSQEPSALVHTSYLLCYWLAILRFRVCRRGDNLVGDRNGYYLRGEDRHI